MENSGTVNVLVTAAGEDRPGIVAAVTKVLFEIGANLEDSAMTRLEGAFAMLVIARVERQKLGGLLERVAALGEQMRLKIAVNEMSAAEVREPASSGEPFIISLYGGDRPGLVYRVTSMLAERGINITDVMTRRSHAAEGGPLYQFVIEVELPRNVDGDKLMRELEALGREMQVQISGHPMEMVEL